jgi:hypothetical protein
MFNSEEPDCQRRWVAELGERSVDGVEGVERAREPGVHREVFAQRSKLIWGDVLAEGRLGVDADLGLASTKAT